MPTDHRGFTLIETLIATSVLVSGLAAVAVLFSYSTATNAVNRQRTAGALLVYEKLEQLKASPLDGDAWIVGGDLNPDAPVAGYVDYVTVDPDGALQSGADDAAAYMRVWQIAGTFPRQATVIVYANRSGLTRGRLELARASTLVSSTF